MFCFQCGHSLPERARYCPQCGAAQRVDIPPPVNFGFAAQPPPARNKSSVKHFLMVVIPVAVLLLLAGVVFFVFFRDVSPLLTVNRALNNLYAEAAERVDATPLKALGMLSDTLKDGSVAIDFNYRDSWDGDEVSGTVLFLSKMEERDFALVADLSGYGQNIDFEARMDKERIAFRSKLFDDKFYGLTYGTFREDIRPFGELIRLDDEMMDSISDAVDALNEALNKDASVFDTYPEQYSDLLNVFFNNCVMTSGKSRIESGGASVRCTKVSFTITEDALFSLANDLYQLLENDETIRDYFYFSDSPLPGGIPGGMAYDELMEAFNESIREFESSYSGEIILSFYVGRGDRMLRFEIDADISYDGDSVSIRTAFDFGTQSPDTWVLDISITGHNDDSSIKIVWYYLELAGCLENTLTVVLDESDQITLTSFWLPDVGDFSLSYVNGDGNGDQVVVTGTFLAAGDGFRLIFKDLFTPNDERSLTFEIAAVSGAEINQIEFINLDLWGEVLTQRFGQLVVGLGADFFEFLFRNLLSGSSPI